MEVRQLACPKTWRKTLLFSPPQSLQWRPPSSADLGQDEQSFLDVSRLRLEKLRPLWSEQSYDRLLTGRKTSRLKGFLLYVNGAVTLLTSDSSSRVFHVFWWLVRFLHWSGQTRNEWRHTWWIVKFFLRPGQPGELNEVMFYWHWSRARCLRYYIN